MINIFKNPPNIANKPVSFSLPEIKKQALPFAALYKMRTENVLATSFRFLSQLGAIHFKPGVLYFLANMLKTGNTTIGAKEIANKLESNGISLDFSCNKDSFSATIYALNDKIEYGLEIFANCLLDCSFEQNEINRVRKQILADIEYANSNSDSLVDIAFSDALYQNTPFALMNFANQKNINKITKEDLINARNSILDNPNNSFIYLEDMNQKNNVVEILNSHFKPREERKIHLNHWQITDNAGLMNLIARKDATQASLRIGNFAPNIDSQDYVPFRMIINILGGMLSSRLNQDLREKRGLTYGVGATVSRNKFHSHYLINAGVSTDRVLEAREAILNHLNDIHQSGVEQEELERVKHYIAGSFLRSMEPISEQTSILLSLINADLSFDYYSKYLERLYSIELEEINVVAQKYFNPNDTVTAICADNDTIKSILSGSDYAKICSAEGYITEV